MFFSYIHKSAKIDEYLLLKYGFSKIEKSSEVSFFLKKLFIEIICRILHWYSVAKAALH